jgi:hypothetical protein
MARIATLVCCANRRYYLAMIQAGKIPNPLVDGNFEVGERRRRRSLEQQTAVGGAATHADGGRPQDLDLDLERAVEMTATASSGSPQSARRRSAPGPPPSTITREDLVVDLATELSALEAAIEASKQLQLPQDEEVHIDEDVNEDEALRRAIEESKQEWTAQQQRRSSRTP